MAKKKVVFPIDVHESREHIRRLQSRAEARRETLETVTRFVNDQAQEDAKKWQDFWDRVQYDNKLKDRPPLRLEMQHGRYVVVEVKKEEPSVKAQGDFDGT